MSDNTFNMQDVLVGGYVPGEGINDKSIGNLSNLAGIDLGLDVDSLHLLEDALNKIISDCEQLMKDFGAKEDEWNSALKGHMQSDAIMYVEEVKKVVVQVIAQIKDALAVANESVHVMSDEDREFGENNIGTATERTQALSKNLENEANDAANSIKVDDLGY